MRIDFITCQPNIIEAVLDTSILKKARERDAVEYHIHNLQDYGVGPYRHVDDTPFGGGAGMILKCEPVFECMDEITKEHTPDEVVFMTPDAPTLTQTMCNQLSMKQHIVLLAGHYKGIDQRIRDNLVTREISLGQFVLTGGELPAIVLADSIVRLLPKATNDPESVLHDSYQTDLLDCPWYTKPAEYRGLSVPEVLLSGNHARIEAWRQEESERKTDAFNKTQELS